MDPGKGICIIILFWMILFVYAYELKWKFPIPRLPKLPNLKKARHKHLMRGKLKLLKGGKPDESYFRK